MLSTVSSNIFEDSKSITLRPMVFAEWNQNIYNPPYITVAGTGSIQTNITTSAILTTLTGSAARPGFTTRNYVMTADGNTITYNVTASATSAAFKVITYIKTNQATPIMANIYAEGDDTQFGSSSVEINSFGWTKVETYIGGSSSTDYIEDFTYNIVLNRFNNEDAFPNIQFTVPEVFPVSFFNYQYNSIWPTDVVFNNFRPGESYVNTGSSLFEFPTNFRKVDSPILDGYTSNVYMPTSSIIQNPKLFNVAPPVPFYKNGLVNDMCQYKYFVSDINNRSISALYKGAGVSFNKLVIKFNTIMATPIVSIAINGSNITVDGSNTVDLSANVSKENGGIREDVGVLVLYWTGSGWSRSRWSVMPEIGADGTITKITTANRITITQIANTLRNEFQSYNSESLEDDATRMQIIEVSPRIEIDLTQYVIDVSINKTMDNRSTVLPISAMNSNDALINFSAIPLGNILQPIPIFSNSSNYSKSVLANMLKKNVKMYINFYLQNYHTESAVVQPTKLIPGGIFYTDTWSESDSTQIAVQCYDISRYLQSAQVADYVCSLRSVLDIITNLLDLSGFTDYDYDSLYRVCNNKSTPLDLAYFYVNSKDTTIIDALNKIFLPYQIAAFIDEYGVMRFLSISDILGSTQAPLVINDADIVEGGYSIINKAKPGKISMRYEAPKIKQSLALQNLALDQKSPSFIYTTSNDIVWSQQNSDSVGMNYLKESMNKSQNYFVLDTGDLLDIFHTYNLNTNGYAAIENEVVSFVYKQYSLSDDTTSAKFVSVKNDLELDAEINRFNKKYSTGLKTSNGTTRPEDSTTVTPTGKITAVQRGMFGTKISDHTVLTETNKDGKNIKCKQMSSTYSITGDGTYSAANDNEFVATTSATGKTLFYPVYERSTVVTEDGTGYYRTYSTKFNLRDDVQKCSAGLFFNMGSSETNANGAYFVELVKYNTFASDGVTPNSPAKFSYALVVYTVAAGVQSIIAYSDVTTVVTNILNNTEKVLQSATVSGKPGYIVKPDKRYQNFNLRAVTYKSTGTDGESNAITNLLSIFLNNNEIKGWRRFVSNKWIPLEVNTNTNLIKKISYATSITPGTIFGSFVSASPVQISGISYPSGSASQVGGIREIYATYKPLKERSVSYYFQDREFLNGLVQNQNVFSRSHSYMMQTKPEVIGINVYDIQYTTPAALSVDVWPIEYNLKYFPGNDVVDQRYLQTKEVDEYSLSYSTVLNTGFRAKFAIANNTSHMVYLMKDSDQMKQTTVRLNLWTHEIIANSDPEIIEKVIDYGNLSEAIQLDSNWIQSRDSANRLINTIANSIENFSKEVTLDIFGNPLIQVGDIVELTYPIAGLNQQKYFVNSVSHDFKDGLSTRLGLNMVFGGVAY